MASTSVPILEALPKTSFLAGKRVAIYTDDAGEGGVAVYAHAIACGLAARGLDVTVVQAQMVGPLQEAQRNAGVKHQWLPYQTRRGRDHSFEGHEQSRAAFAAIRPDVVLFANCDPKSNIAAKAAALEAGIPIVIVEGLAYPVHTVDNRTAVMLRHTAEQYRAAKVVIAVSHDTLQTLRACFGLPATKGEVVYYGRPDEFFRPSDPEIRAARRATLGIEPHQVLCLTVGRLEVSKGYDYLVSAIAQLCHKPVWRDLQFAWIGSGQLEGQLRDSLARLGAADRVHFFGHQYDLADWYDAGDVFVLPSRFEGMPLSIMEAMAKGLPVVASAVSGIPEELGPTGRKLTSPHIDETATVAELATTLEAWTSDAGERRTVGRSCQARAEVMFREERMIDETTSVLERSQLPRGDYVSPGFRAVRFDQCFPHMTIGDPRGHAWPYLRWQVPHNWYHDRRMPVTGFANRDEAHILYNTALRFRGKRGLEIGCWLGWSACHLAAGGVLLDVIDPVLARPDFRQDVEASLGTAGVLDRVNLVGGTSPAAVEELARAHSRRWSLFFVDGDHEGQAPVSDAAVCAEFAEPDALVLFHDLAAPDVAAGFEYLARRGWNAIVYSTMQIMGAAWRGNVEPVVHVPDADVAWSIPQHLLGYAVSGR